MGKYIGSKCKLSRRLGTDLFLKSGFLKDINSKCKIKTPPGQHGYKKKRVSDYSLQLKAKQMLKYIYGVLEKTFYLYYKQAKKNPGITSEILLQILESRLDNVVYRMGFASTRAEARQMINHKSIVIKKNNTSKIVSIPSYRVTKNDIIQIKITCKKTKKNKNGFKKNRKYKKIFLVKCR